MIKVGLIYDEVMLLHKNPEGEHVEKPARIKSIFDEFSSRGITNKCIRVEGRKATDEELNLCHDREYIKKLNGMKQSFCSGDMFMNEYTVDVAKFAAGSCLNMVNLIIAGQLDRGFCLVRPPGHHATCSSFSGFCYFNNVMIAAINGTNNDKKILVVDIDVHFGDGSVRIMKSAEHYTNEKLMYYSIHRYDNGKFYPHDTDGKTGISMNGRLICDGFSGSQGDGYYLNSIMNLVPYANRFKPDIIIVSAGFDAADGDQLGFCTVTPRGYYQITELLKTICPKIMMVLEGGYNLASISNSAAACMESLLKP